MTVSSRLLVPAVILGLGLATGCSGSSDAPAGSGGTPTSSAPTVAPTKAPTDTPPTTRPAPQPSNDAVEPGTPAAQPTPAPQPTAAASRNRFVARCQPHGAARQRLEGLDPRSRTIVEPQSGSRLPVTVAGSGRTVLVVLHDEAGNACRAQEFLAAAGGDRRFRVVAVDLCTSAAAACVGELLLDDAAQTGLVLEWVRERFDPRKVVVLGVGSGGTAAVRAASVGLPADAIVNVSGPAAAADLRRITVPMLHLHEDLSSREASGARLAAREGARGVRLGAAPASGWKALVDDLRLTGAGRQALDFAGR